ncbi:DNA excision repair protein ERCC-8 [Thoreauomyces humboldtii]|nr:DNA excision repair protein ERCC-8 [Thoreauomyces humboldtii]
MFEIENHIYDHDMSPIATSHHLIAAATEDQNVRLCDMRSGASTHSMQGHKAPVLAVRWSPREEHMVASAGLDHTARLWDIRKANACITCLDQYKSAEHTPGFVVDHVATAHNGAVNGLAFTSDGLNLITTGHDENIRLWDLATTTNTLTNYGTQIRNSVTHALHPCITYLSSCSPPLLFHPSDNRQTMVFDLFSGERLMQLRKHAARVACVALRGGDTQDVLTGSYDRSICWWAPPKTVDD